MNAPRGIVFDFGNVLYHVDFPGMARTLAGDRAGEFLARFSDSPLLTLYETGRCGLDDVLSHLAAEGYPLGRERFLDAYLSLFSPVAGMAQRVEQLSRALPLALLSNTSPEHAALFIEQVPEFGFFRSRVYSFELGCMKPAPALYHEAAARLALPPSALLYVDDLAVNVEGARAVGMTAVQFVGVEALDRDLARLGVALA